MHKQLTLLLILISSLSFAQNPVQKLEELKEITAQLKIQVSEKEKAVNDFKSAGIVLVATIAASLLAQNYLMPKDLPTHQYAIKIIGIVFETGKFTSADAFLKLGETGGLLYSLYKSISGAKRLYFSHHPKPKETPEKSKIS